MILLAGPVAGFALGWLVRRWSAVAGVAVVIVVLSAIGLPLGWFNSEDAEPLGGLIVIAAIVELPFLACMALGVWARRSQKRRRSGAVR